VEKIFRMQLFLKRNVLVLILLLIIDFPNAADITAQSVQLAEIQFIYTSDPHYGVKRSSFQGVKDVDAHIVNLAMISKINKLPELYFPNDGGLKSGKKVGAFDFLAETGDIANRQEGSGDKAIQSAAQSWKQFKEDYLKGLQIIDKNNQKSPVYLVPGNHDVTNALGFYKKMTPGKDATAIAEIYNMMMSPKMPLTKDSYDYAKHKINYSKDIAGIHFIFIIMWPDSYERKWMESDLKKVGKNAPVIIFTHDQPDVESKHFTNPNGNNDINETDKFENLLADKLADGKTVNDPSVIEQKEFIKFLKSYQNITAYFHGNSNWNEFYDWIGPDYSAVLHTFRVDSPVKGEVSGKDETKLSFQVVTIDVASRIMTVRECLWNPDPKNPDANVTWGGSVTVALYPRPVSAE
jgi:hypothetical protein